MRLGKTVFSCGLAVLLLGCNFDGSGFDSEEDVLGGQQPDDESADLSQRLTPGDDLVEAGPLKPPPVPCRTEGNSGSSGPGPGHDDCVRSSGIASDGED